MFIPVQNAHVQRLGKKSAVIKRGGVVDRDSRILHFLSL